ncbi:family 43 glycosylhydrolase [Sorangium sp. So ce131]|uniref:family 43 glycosylhydrolase n=1 Tax=Sorangium sp. So ce131 TaxID=3133282 RepID=UPI003F60C52A
MVRSLISSRRRGLLCAAVPIALSLGMLLGSCGDDAAPAEGATASGTTGSAAGGNGGSGGGGNGGDGGGGGGHEAFATYTNPLSARIRGAGVVASCPEPSILGGESSVDGRWVLFCSSGPLNDEDRDAGGGLNKHLLPILQSEDLVAWTYVGDALDVLPPYAEATADIRSPEIQRFGDKYHLYYTVTEVIGGGSAIGVATSDSPTGPWVQEASPAVEPHPAPCCAGSRRWVNDPGVVVDERGKRYIYYGSYYGGLSVRELSEDGLTADPLSQREVSIPNRYEAAYVVRRGEHYVLFGSAATCCNGPLSGYAVFAGRSKSPFGPFVDREGVSLLAASVGGTPVLAMSGNRWVGTGHIAVFTDRAGQDWAVYHGVDRGDPYLAQTGGGLVTKRQLLMDPLDWVDGWPMVRGGRGASDAPQPAPAAREGDEGHHAVELQADEVPGAVLEAYSDELDGAALDGRWSWVREPAEGTFGLSGGALRWSTQSADLFEDLDSASVLIEEAPAGDYMVETKVTLDVPPEGCCFNFAQAGIVIYGDDDSFVKLVSYSSWDTRQIEFAKEVSAAGEGEPRYGSTVLGAAGRTVWLRVARQAGGGEERYTAFSSRDGRAWVRGGTWTHEIGGEGRIGVVAMGAPEGTTWPARFEYVRVYRLGE